MRWITIISLFLCHVVTAQTLSFDELKSELEKIQAFYAGQDKLHFKLAYTSFINEESETPYDRGQGEFILYKEASYLKQLNTITVQNEDLLVSFNDDHKELFLGTPVDLVSLSGSFDYESFKGVFETASIGTLAGTTFLAIKLNKHPQYSKIIIVYDKSSHRPKGIKLYYRKYIEWESPDGEVLKGYPLVITSFSLVKSNEEEKKRKTTMSNYLIQVNGEYKGVGDCQGYKITDTRLKDTK